MFSLCINIYLFWEDAKFADLGTDSCLKTASLSYLIADSTLQYSNSNVTDKPTFVLMWQTQAKQLVYRHNESENELMGDDSAGAFDGWKWQHADRGQLA